MDAIPPGWIEAAQPHRLCRQETATDTAVRQAILFLSTLVLAWSPRAWDGVVCIQQRVFLPQLTTSEAHDQPIQNCVS